MQPHERIIGLYEKNAAAWDELRGRTLNEREWIDAFTAHLTPGASILDLGCGSGEPVARHLIESGYEVTGVDSSPSLIAMCRERFPDHEWLVADMRALDLGRRFDGILAWHSFFHLHFDDQRAMFPRFAAHAKPDALLMFSAGPMYGEAFGEWQGEPLYHASLSQEEYADCSKKTRSRPWPSAQANRSPMARQCGSRDGAKTTSPQVAGPVCPGSLGHSGSQGWSQS